LSEERENRRRYSEEEFALILRRASELHVMPRQEGGRGGPAGFTLEEIQSIAAEAGIEPGAVTRAASLLGTMEWTEKKGLAAILFGEGGNVHLDLEIAGKLPREEVGHILEVIRRVMEHQGEATSVLDGMEWKTIGHLSAVNVNITPRGDRTSIQIVGDRSAAGALTFAMPIGAAAVSVGILGAIFEPTSAAGIVSLVAGSLGAGFLTARALWSTGTSRFRRRLNSLMEAISRSVETVSIPAGSREQAEEKAENGAD